MCGAGGRKKLAMREAIPDERYVGMTMLSMLRIHLAYTKKRQREWILSVFRCAWTHIVVGSDMWR